MSLIILLQFLYFIKLSFLELYWQLPGLFQPWTIKEDKQNYKVINEGHNMGIMSVNDQSSTLSVLFNWTQWTNDIDLLKLSPLTSVWAAAF